MSRSIIAVFHPQIAKSTSSVILTKLLQSPERIDSSKPDVSNAELVACAESTCHKVGDFKVVIEGLSCNNQLLEITWNQKLPNGSTAVLSGFLERNHGLISKKQYASTNCIIIRRFFVSKESRIVCVDDICHKTPKNQMDHVIIMELVVQLRIVTLAFWSLGYYDEETATIYIFSCIKVS